MLYFRLMKISCNDELPEYYSSDFLASASRPAPSALLLAYAFRAPPPAFIQ
jgi:hypothetical protein